MKKTHHFLISLLLVGQLITSCHPTKTQIEPIVTITPLARNIESKPSAFPNLSLQELRLDYGKEMKIAEVFAKEFDLYRAITTYKRALVLMPVEAHERRLQAEYGIIQAYYLGQKYGEATDFFESSDLRNVTTSFPAFGDLLIILYDSYQKNSECDKAAKILEIINKYNPEFANKLSITKDIVEADFVSLENKKFLDPKLDPFLFNYYLESKSIRKAETLNALLPGAGFYYIGQKKAAVTSFVLNTLFIATTYQLFNNGYVGAGIFTLSLETGWYLGGIYGAGLGAKEYNERLYERHAKNYLLETQGFPLLMLETAF